MAADGGHAAVVAALLAAGGYWGEAACVSGSVVNPEGPSPPCLCAPPTVGTPGNCVLASAKVTLASAKVAFASAKIAPASAAAAPALAPASAEDCEDSQFYDAAVPACVPVAVCDSPKVLYADANDCHAPGGLRAAVEAGDLNLVNHFIAEHGADVNEASGSGVTPLHLAANGGHVAIAVTLIAEGADVNLKNDDDETPLYWAAGGGYAVIVAALLARRAEVDAKNDEGQTPLHWAARNGRAAVVVALLAGGADVNAKNDDGEAPLHLAADGGHAVVVATLLAGGAEVNAKNDNDETPLHYARRRRPCRGCRRADCGGGAWGRGLRGSGSRQFGGALPALRQCESLRGIGSVLRRGAFDLRPESCLRFVLVGGFV